MKKAKIAVVPLYDFEKESYWMVPGYMDALTELGAMPLMLPLTDNWAFISQATEEFDGFLFTGGQDVSPEMYGEKVSDKCGECCKIRDYMEKALFDEAMKRNKPILGICRGIQLINVLMGGSLYQDLPTEKPSDIEHHQKPPYDIPIHKVKIIRDSILYDILDKEEISVNSYHHQAIKELGKGLKAMAYSEDGLVEAVSAEGKGFVAAVQWHPEFSYKTDENSKRIFKAFTDAAAG